MMVNTTNDVWNGQLPTRTPETAPFWDACERGVFLLQRCNSCDKFQYYYRRHCSHCWSTDIADFPSSGRGTVWSYSIVYRNNTRHFRERVPYVVAVVELEGGVKVVTNVVECDPDSVHIGTDVELRMLRASGGETVPVFRPVAP